MIGFRGGFLERGCSASWFITLVIFALPRLGSKGGWGFLLAVLEEGMEQGVEYDTSTCSSFAALLLGLRFPRVCVGLPRCVVCAFVCGLLVYELSRMGIEDFIA